MNFTRLADSLSSFLIVALCLSAFAACDDDDGGSGTPAQCTYDSDCELGFICANGACVAQCQEDRDCPAGQSCVGGMCHSDVDDVGEDAAADGGDDAAQDTSDDTAPDTPRPEGFGSITGQVHFRLYDQTRLPVAQPTVYWRLPGEPPEPLPEAASCDCGIPPGAIVGNIDGTFTLTDVPAGPILLVVQKGQFRRVRQVDVVADSTTTAPNEALEMPVRNDPEAGDTIPRIVIGTGRFDSIEDVFAKLRLGPITDTFGFDYETWMLERDQWGVELALYQQPRDLEDNGLELDAPSFPSLLSDPEILDYHFVFAPCAEYDTYGTLMTSAAVRNNIAGFVDAGGKLYVTDYAYDVLEQTFPEYVDFRRPDGDMNGNADGRVGDPDYTGIAASGTLRYESHNMALDSDLARWLGLLQVSNDGTVQTEGNWVNIRGVSPVTQCCDDGGNEVNVLPDVVMSGPNGVDPFIGDFGPSHETWFEAEEEGANFPHTLRFDVGCGEVMYSTYHTVESFERTANLQPQELVLLYLILEINECNPNPIKRPE